MKKLHSSGKSLEIKVVAGGPEQQRGGLERILSSNCSSTPEQGNLLTLLLQGQGEAFSARWGVASAAGAEPGGSTKVNQDSWVVAEHLGRRQVALLGVADGHGLAGDQVSSKIVSSLPRLYARNAHFTATPPSYREAFEETFSSCNSIILEHAEINSAFSGSTLVLVLLQAPGRVTVANVGDSRCFLGRVSPDGSVRAVSLSRDHSCDDPEEAARIVACKGRIGPFMVGGEPCGPLRVWLADLDTPGLAMTRALGDSVAASVGVSAVPEVIEAQLLPEDLYMVLCSDGVYDFQDNEEIVAKVHAAAQRGVAPGAIAATLVDDARALWRQAEAGVIDDCTCIVIFLGKAARAPTALSSPLGPQGIGSSRISSASPSLATVPRRLGAANSAAAGSSHIVSATALGSRLAAQPDKRKRRLTLV